MAMHGSRTNPERMAARFLLKPGRKYEDSVKVVEPNDTTTALELRLDLGLVGIG
jgi:hypothetical protein